VRAIRVVLCGAMLFAATADAAAQPGAPFRPSRQLFSRLFPADPRGRLRPPRPPDTVWRVRAVNRDCGGCAVRSGVAHLVIDSPQLTDAWLDLHDYQSGGGLHGDNAAIADFWYDAVHRRLFTRSLVLQEVEDPADLRLGRAPGSYPNTPDFAALLPPGTTVGHVGFVRWGSSGFGSYFAAVQGAVRDAGTGYLDLATATGTSGTTRTGSRYSSEDLIKHVRLHPSGEVEVGFETDPDSRPETSLLVRGNAVIEGTLIVSGESVPAAPPPPPPSLSCTVRTTRLSGRTAAVACDAGQLATGGGGSCGSGEMRSSRPTATADQPSGWEIACSKSGVHDAYVICCSR
jgi:hypothetical protein